MADQPHIFKRLVLRLEASSRDRTMPIAVELAELLHIELLGLFLEDPGLRYLGAFPFVRELRPLEGGWHPIDLDQLNHDLDIAVRNTERLFIEAAKDLTTRHQFEVIRESASHAIASISRSGDIVIITQPSTPAGRAAQQFSWPLEAAFHSDAAVMVVPARIARVAGPVIAIAIAPDDPSIRAAAGIAIAAKEDLVIVHAHEGKGEDPGVGKLAADTGLTIKHVFAGKPSLSDPAACVEAIHNVEERLVVMARGIFAPELALSVASSRRVPVLVIASSVDAPHHNSTGSL
jgi:hypothetical protein